MENTFKHKIGEKAKVEIWNSKKKISEFHNCEITDIVNATDRDYRVNVKLSNGKEYYECAPECVVQLQLQLTI